jgi:hypothetical protein
VRLNSFTFSDVPSMHDGMCRRFMLGKYPNDYNWLGGSDVGMDNLTLGIESFDWNLDLKQYWITRLRWNMMVRQYINPEALDQTLDMVGKYLHKKSSGKRGVSTLRMQAAPDDDGLDEALLDHAGPGIEEMRTNLVSSWNAGRRTSRRWGSCMLTMTFRMLPHPTVTLNSRTSYFGYLALLDVNVAHVFARMCGDIVGVHPGEMQFIWQLNIAQYHSYRSLAWPLSQPEYRSILDKYADDRDNPKVLARKGLRNQINGYNSMRLHDIGGILYGDETYASRLRMRRRFHTEVMGEDYGDQFEGGTRYPRNTKKAKPLPHLWTGDLDFSAIHRGM